VPNTTYGTPYVSSSDYVTNYPTVSQALANQIDVILGPLTTAWTTFTPTLLQSATPTQTINRARYLKVGRMVKVYADISIGSGTSGTSGQIITFNFSGACTAADTRAIYGGFRHFDAGVTNYVGMALGATTTTANFYVDGYGANHGQQPVQLTSGDVFQVWLTIEAAS